MSYYVYSEELPETKPVLDYNNHDQYDNEPFLQTRGKDALPFKPLQFDGIDYEFIKKLWTTAGVEFDFDGWFLITQQIIEDWELFKKDLWFDDYDDAKHQTNIEYLNDAAARGVGVYMFVS